MSKSTKEALHNSVVARGAATWRSSIALCSLGSGLLPATQCSRLKAARKDGAGFLSASMILISSCGLLLPVTASADEYHYNNVLIGDRAAGMGGAYTAISDDPSGLYYNPAGIAYAHGSNISVSANALHISKTVYKDALGAGHDWVRLSSALLPNFFGIIQPLGRGKVGFSYAVPDSIIEDQNQTFYDLPNGVSRYALNFNKNDSSYYFGPSYALELSKEFSVGATLYGYYRRNEWIQNQVKNFTSGKYEWQNAFYKNTEWGIKPIVGVMWSPTDKVSAGLSISKLAIAQSDARYQLFCGGDATGVCDPASTGYNLGTAPYRAVVVSDAKRVHPFTSTAGLAYFHSNVLLVSGDFSFNSKVKDTIFGDRLATWNAALGTEYYLNEKWAVKAGLFTDRANTPRIKSGDTDAFDHVDLYGGSLSTSYFTRQSSITAGATFRYGTGKAQILGGQPVQDVTSWAATYFLSAAYFY